MEKCGAHSCSDRFLKAGLIALLALILCGAAIGAAGAANPFPADGVLVNGQTYTLDEDIVLTNNLTVPAGVTCTIDLRGYVLKGNGNGTVITINGPDGETPAGNLTLKDTDGEDLPATTPHYFTFVDDGPWTLDTSTPTSFVDLVNFDRVVAKAAAVGTYHVKITGGVITGGSTAEQSYGGGVNVLNGSFTMSGGNIVGNTTGKDAYGGGVCVYEGSTFTMSGGNIVGNYAYSGGGVYVEGSESSASTFIMTDGSITGNSVKYSGGGVYVHHFSTRHGIFTMSGGKIVGNRASVGSTTSNGGGVNVVDGATFNVSGSPVIKDNMKNAKGGDVVDNVYFDDVEVITVTDTLSAPAEIWVAQDASSTEAFATGDNAVLSASAKYFHPDTGFAGAIVGGGSDTDKLYWDTNPALIKYNGNLYYGKADTTHLLAIIGGTGSPFTSTNAGYDKDSHTLTLKENQNVSLVHTLEIVAPKTHGNPFTIDLNGQVLQRSAADGTPDFSVITINPGAELAVTDNSSGKYHYFTVQAAGQPWLLDDSATTGAIPLEDITDASQLEKDKIIRVTGGVITGGNGNEVSSKWYGGGVYNEGKLTLSDGNIVGNTATYGGGGGVYNKGTLTMFGGNIAGNAVASGCGGCGVYVYSGEFTMSGGKIVGNTATYMTISGGGVYVESGKFTMSGSAGITGNTVNGNGGGVYNKGTLTLSGGNIAGNTVNFGGGGVYVDSGAFNVSGSPEISGNTGSDKTTPNNVYLSDTDKLTLAGDLTGGEIRITTVNGAEPAEGVTFGTVDGGTKGAEHFVADGAIPLVGSIAEGELKWVKPAGWVGDVFVPDANGYTTAAALVAALNTGTGHENTAVESPIGTVKLLKDVKLGGTLKLGGDAKDSFILDLGGHVLSRDSSKGDFSVITVDPGKFLKVIDSASSAPHYFKYVGDGAWTYAGDELPSDSYSTKFILTGTETGFTPFTREDADNAAEAAIEAGESVYIKVTGGVITGGNVTGHGGGVHVEGMFSMSGGNIIGNKASNDGGGVCIWCDSNPAKFSMSGGSIAGNYAPWGGGLNIKTQNQESASMTDGMIIGNTAGDSAGGVYIANNNTTGAFTMSGGSIKENKATNTGGGVRVGYGDTFTMSGDADITGNTATSGGGVYVSTDSGTTQFTMNGGSIKGNTATSSGGGVFVNSGCTFSVSGTPKIKDNKKDGAANNVYLNGDDKLKLTGPLSSPAEIHITSPAAVGKFGEVADTYTKPTQTDADHFVLDSTSAILAAVLKEGTPKQLEWAAAKKIEIIQPTDGKITSLPINAAIAGTDVHLTATPDAGYELDKWDVKKEDSTPVTVSGNKFTMPDSAVTVSATFKPADFTVSFDMQGHGTQIGDQKVTPGGFVPEPEAPTAAGWNFFGWYKEKECINAWNFATDTVSEDTTLYAKWVDATPWTVTFDWNGADEPGYPESVTAYLEKPMPSLPFLSSYPPEKYGYTFMGYFDAATGGTQYYNANGTSARNWDKTANTTLYAHWWANEIHIDTPDKDAYINLEAVPVDPDNGRVYIVEVDNVDSAVAFRGSVERPEVPPIPGFTYHKTYAMFQIDTKPSGSTKLIVYVQLEEGDEPKNVYLRHFNTETDKWDNSNIKANSYDPISDLIWVENAWRFEFPITECSPFAVVYEIPVKKSSHSSQGTSVWATEPVEPTETPTPTAEPTQSPTQSVPTVKPTEQPTQAKSPAPFIGILAGLGAATVLFGLRRK